MPRSRTCGGGGRSTRTYNNHEINRPPFRPSGIPCSRRLDLAEHPVVREVPQVVPVVCGMNGLPGKYQFHGPQTRRCTAERRFARRESRCGRGVGGTSGPVLGRYRKSQQHASNRRTRVYGSPEDRVPDGYRRLHKILHPLDPLPTLDYSATKRCFEARCRCRSTNQRQRQRLRNPCDLATERTRACMRNTPLRLKFRRALQSCPP